MASSVLPKLVGQRVKRCEDPRLIQGRATYVDDVSIPGMLHRAFKRSDVADGRIRSIDVHAAAAIDGTWCSRPGEDPGLHASSAPRRTYPSLRGQWCPLQLPSNGA